MSGWGALTSCRKPSQCRPNITCSEPWKVQQTFAQLTAGVSGRLARRPGLRAQNRQPPGREQNTLQLCLTFWRFFSYDDRASSVMIAFQEILCPHFHRIPLVVDSTAKYSMYICLPARYHCVHECNPVNMASYGRHRHSYAPCLPPAAHQQVIP